VNLDQFSDDSKCFSVVLFVQPEDIKLKEGVIKKCGDQKNVRLVVQPCPYEGIEFLYRVSLDIPGHQTSVDTDIFWQSIAVRQNIPNEAFSKLSKHHYEFLHAILEQDVNKVMQEKRALEALVKTHS